MQIIESIKFLYFLYIRIAIYFFLIPFSYQNVKIYTSQVCIEVWKLLVTTTNSPIKDVAELKVHL